MSARRQRFASVSPTFFRRGWGRAPASSAGRRIAKRIRSAAFAGICALVVFKRPRPFREEFSGFGVAANVGAPQYRYHSRRTIDLLIVMLFSNIIVVRSILPLPSKKNVTVTAIVGDSNAALLKALR